MPEFDTYKGIERFARAPDDPAAALSYFWLMERTKRQLMWRALSGFGSEGLAAGYSMQLGCAGASDGSTSKRGLDLEALAELAKPDRDAVYIDLCKRAGITIDPVTLTKTTSTRSE